MVDLELLRRVGETFGHPEHRKLIAEAADEIERLRDELKASIRSPRNANP